MKKVPIRFADEPHFACADLAWNRLSNWLTACLVFNLAIASPRDSPSNSGRAVGCSCPLARDSCIRIGVSPPDPVSEGSCDSSPGTVRPYSWLNRRRVAVIEANSSFSRPILWGPLSEISTAGLPDHGDVIVLEQAEPIVVMEHVPHVEMSKAAVHARALEYLAVVTAEDVEIELLELFRAHLLDLNARRQ